MISKHGFTTSFLDLPPTAAVTGYAIRLPNCQPTDNFSLVLKYCQSVYNRNSSFLKCFYCNRPRYLLQHKYCQSVYNRNSSFLKCFYCNRPRYLLQHKYWHLTGLTRDGAYCFTRGGHASVRCSRACFHAMLLSQPSCRNQPFRRASVDRRAEVRSCLTSHGRGKECPFSGLTSHGRGKECPFSGLTGYGRGKECPFSGLSSHGRGKECTVQWPNRLWQREGVPVQWSNQSWQREGVPVQGPNQSWQR